ncbi:prepilin-type N-terminal cleavage/methylation domain-containing protein [Candidatus Daviesbacteria bacterium]|nr:prepilin-type N-terminal cleavage/methylation domain-containing protein [Candidatus Daviesbacteria bacterium]
MKKSAQVHKGFTLVELLVVIAIIAILAAVVVLIINPLELTRRGRDAARLTDLANLQQAINVAVQEATASAAAILCSGGATPCSGSSNTGTRATGGTGWVKVNLSAQNSVSVPTLPIDPLNDTTNHYTYCSDGDAWEINTVLESEQQKGKMATDGGNEPAADTTGRYEVGSNLTLIAASGGSCTY